MRKKYAKMSSAMKMCIKLDELGEFNENLTFVTKEQFCKRFIDLDDETEETKSNKNTYSYSVNYNRYLKCFFFFSIL